VIEGEVEERPTSSLQDCGLSRGVIEGEVEECPISTFQDCGLSSVGAEAFKQGEPTTD
jgi:hypothetical protein